MRIFRRVAILILSCFLFVGCAIIEDSRDIYKPNAVVDDKTRLYTKSRLASVLAPIKTDIKPEGFITENGDIVYIRWGILNFFVAQIKIEPERINYRDSEKYLIKENFDILEKKIKNHTYDTFYETLPKIRYKKVFIEYIDGVRCRTYHNDPVNIYETTKEGFKGAIWTQRYEAYCSIYTIKDNPVTITINYEYSYNIRNKDLFKGDDASNQKVLDMIKNEFRGHIQTIFSTIKFPRMDREKMRKEGLLVDKPYKVQF